jgi:hypothetical protein
MSDIKHIGAMTVGIIGEGLMNRNEKIKDILESNTSISCNSDLEKLLNTRISDTRTCDSCGCSVRDIDVVASAFGPITIGVCNDCLTTCKEPYNLMVNYISCAGRFPDDISDVYKREVRRQLKLHNKSEGEFIADVDKAIKEEMEFFKDYEERNSDQSF